MVGRGDLYTRQPHATDTHGKEEGRSDTPTSWCHCVPTSSHPHSNEKNWHTCKEEMDTLPNLTQNTHGPTTQTTTWKEGGGGAGGSPLRGCLCGACVRPLGAPPP